MSQSLLAILVATLPLAALAWSLGWLAEQTRIGPRARAAIWQLAVLAPLLLAPAVWAAASLDLNRTDISPASAPLPIAQAPAVLPSATPGMGPVSTNTPPAQPVIPYAGLVLALIACGSAIKLVGSAGRNLRLGGLLAHARPCASPELEILLADAARRAGVRPPGLKLWAGGEPVLVGALAPVILLPERLARDLPTERISHVFSHELAHLRAHDHWRLPLLDALTSLFWFNPPLAACAARLMNAQEEACDARALAGADRRARRAYAETLFNLLKAGAVAEPAVAFTGWRRSLAVRRLRAILSPAPVSIARGRMAILAAGLAIGGGVISAGYALAATLPAAQSPSASRQGASPAPVGARPTSAAAVRPATEPAARPGPSPQPGMGPVDQTELNSLDQGVRRTRDAADQAAMEMAQTVADDAQRTYNDVKNRYDNAAATMEQLNAASTARVRALSDLANLKAQQAQSARFLALGALNNQPPATRPAPATPAASTTLVDTLTAALGQARVERIRQETLLEKLRSADVEALPALTDDPVIANNARSISQQRGATCDGCDLATQIQPMIQRYRDQMAVRRQALVSEQTAKLDLAKAQETALQNEIVRTRVGPN